MGKMLLLSFENSEDDVISEILSILENKQMKICENKNIKKCLEFQGLTINAERRLAVKGNKEIEFTFTEFEILLLLGSQRCTCSFKGEREDVLKHDIEAKVWSEKNLTKCVAVTQGDEAYL